MKYLIVDDHQIIVKALAAEIQTESRRWNWVQVFQVVRMVVADTRGQPMRP